MREREKAITTGFLYIREILKEMPKLTLRLLCAATIAQNRMNSPMNLSYKYSEEIILNSSKCFNVEIFLKACEILHTCYWSSPVSLGLVNRNLQPNTFENVSDS